MYGFIGYMGDFSADNIVVDGYDERTENIKENTCKKEGFYVKQYSLNKFGDDKVFYSKDELVIVLEGIVYNYSEMKEELQADNNAELLAMLYRKEGESFIKKLNGNFCMVIYENKKLLLYTNHTGYKSLFIYKTGKRILFSSDVNWLINTLNRMKMEVCIDTDSAVCLLNHGYMLGENTLVKNLKKILPGHYKKYWKGEISDIEWISYRDIEESVGSYNEQLEQAEDLFIRAVKRIYEKDEEYGYKHFCTLSGGLDSRSVAFVADKIGYKQTFGTIGESGCLDEEIATKIAKDLEGTHFVLHLDSGNYLMDIKNSVIGNGGNITYPGFAHLFTLFNTVNLNNFGQIITGEVGDLLFGGGKEKLKEEKADIWGGAFAKINGCDSLLSKDFIEEEKSRYNNSYTFFLYNRALNSAQNGWYASYKYTESASPFLDMDFMKFILTVPSKYLLKSKFYVNWMERYHPEMCNYMWTTTRTRPNAPELLKKIVIVQTILRTKVLKQALSMNPYQKWMSENVGLNELIMKSIIKDKHYLISQNEILETMYQKVLSAGSIMNYFMLATLLVAVDEYKIRC